MVQDLENLNERRQPMTLDNKLGLTDSLELAKMEEKISKPSQRTFITATST